MTRIVVTGGAGFIGSGVVRSFLADGNAVTVIDDLSTGSATDVPDGATLVGVDISQPAAVDAIAAARPDVVVHAAAQVSVVRSVEDPSRDHAVNVGGTEQVIAGARAGGARRLVFLSSGGAIYGEADGATEETPPAPASPYGKNKLRAEQLVAASGIPYANARLANVYGPGQRADLEGGVVAIFSEAAIRRGAVWIYGDGSQSRDFVHVDDVVTALRMLVASDRSGTWNVGTGIGTSVNELLALVEELVGHAVPHERRPPRPGDVRRSRLSIERIQKELGWEPASSLRQGLAAVLADAR